jgi:hypothetical protein
MTCNQMEEKKTGIFDQIGLQDYYIFHGCTIFRPDTKMMYKNANFTE